MTTTETDFIMVNSNRGFEAALAWIAALERSGVLTRADRVERLSAQPHAGPSAVLDGRGAWMQDLIDPEQKHRIDPCELPNLSMTVMH